MKGSFFINWLSALCIFAVSGPLEAQVVKHERLLSFEEGVPQELSGSNSKLSITEEHYKDGTHSLRWTYEPGAVLSLKKDLKFEPKDPTGKDTYLSALLYGCIMKKPLIKNYLSVSERWEGVYVFPVWHQLYRMACSMGVL